MNDKQPQSAQESLFFDPTNHPDNTLKSFIEFTQTFQLRYAAQFPDPPKVSLDAALHRWKIANTTNEAPDPKPTLEQYDEVVSKWQSKDKVAKFLGMFSSTHFYNDWVAAQPDENLRNTAGWTELITYIKEYYKPTENLTLKNYHFRYLAQESNQTFAAFCNVVEKEAKHCSFKCHHNDCTAEATAVRDQIVYGTTFDKVREEAFNKSWDLKSLRKEGMRMESASKGAAELAGEAINRMGAYSHRNIRNNTNSNNNNNKNNTQTKNLKPITCFNCGTTVTTPIKTHVRKDCPAIGNRCTKCNHTGHFPQCCKKFPDVHQVQNDPPPAAAPAAEPVHRLTTEEDQEYNINIFRVDTVIETPKCEQLLSECKKLLSECEQYLSDYTYLDANEIQVVDLSEDITDDTECALSSSESSHDVIQTVDLTPCEEVSGKFQQTESGNTDAVSKQTSGVSDNAVDTTAKVHDCSNPQHPSTDDAQSDIDNDTYNINVFLVKSSKNRVLPKLKSNLSCDFRVPVIINNSIGTPIADTGAKVSVCGSTQAQKWNLFKRMVPSNVKLKPYNSSPIPVLGTARCAVTFGATSVPVEWHIINGSCEPVLSGYSALQLGIITFNRKSDIFHPVLMIDQDAIGNAKEQVQSILQRYPQNFTGLGRLKNHSIKLHVNPEVKPIRDAPRPTAYHMEDRAKAAIQEMIDEGVIEEHPINEPAPWVSNVVLAPKDDGGLRVTIDARNVNKAIQSSNLPIPKQEDIKAKLSHKRFFSKLDFKSAFWQLELSPESRYLTVFQALGKLYRHTVLTMGMKPAQGELNAALSPLFAHISDAHLIHDDVVIATDTIEEHLAALSEIMEAISQNGLTLNPSKCRFLQREIKFWGMIISEQGVRPDPEKVNDLQYITPPTDKAELVSFLCMMQSNADFIPQFAKKSAILRELTKGNTHFKWEKVHQQCYEQLIADFKEETTLRYFDITKRTFLITDAHKSGFGAILAQGDDESSAKAVAVASRCTSPAEQRYPQIDLEAIGVDYGLSRFRNYLVGSPDITVVVTDHKPLVSIFNGRRRGSIRTENVKFRHQDIDFEVVYRKGSSNQSDYLSRHAKPYANTTEEEQQHANEVNHRLYSLHTTPIIDHIGLATISQETAKDETLNQLLRIIQKSQTWIPKTASDKLRRYSKILSELTVTGNGIILMGDRIVLPGSLQELSIELAHRGSHPGQYGIARRLRSHFFFHDLDAKVKSLVSSCLPCNEHTNKKTSEPLIHHAVPDKCWDAVAVDLFGPMPSKHHVVVVQDLASKYPAAKLVNSTSAEKVLPVLSDIYDTYGNPTKQLSDNGSPFNSSAMNAFADRRGIDLQKIPPLHPSSNPAETFMRPLGKTMKIAHEAKTSEKEALQALLSNYRNTPHPATGISPASMLYRDGQRSVFPRVTVTDEEVEEARKKDLSTKQIRQHQVNAGKYRSDSRFAVGDHVLIRNYLRQRKFDPLFLPDDFIVKEIANDGRCLTVERLSDGAQFKRHPDDLKKFSGTRPETVSPQRNTEREILQQYIHRFSQIANDMEDSFQTLQFHNNNNNNNNNNNRVMRSQGHTLAWNPLMNAGDVVVTAGNSEQLNMLNYQEHWV